MKLRSLVLAAGLAFMAQSAVALTAEEVVADYQGQGFTRVEVRVGPTQIKVEAIRGDQKVEVIYDSATGRALKTETETVEAGENTAPGVRIREQSRDFVRVVYRNPDGTTSPTPGGSGGSSSRDDDDDDRDENDDEDDDSDDESDDDSDDDHGGRGGSDDEDDDEDDDSSGHGGGSDEDDDSDDDSDEGNDDDDDDSDDDGGSDEDDDDDGDDD